MVYERDKHFVFLFLCERGEETTAATAAVAAYSKTGCRGPRRRRPTDVRRVLFPKTGSRLAAPVRPT